MTFFPHAYSVDQGHNPKFVEGDEAHIKESPWKVVRGKKNISPSGILMFQVFTIKRVLKCFSLSVYVYSVFVYDLCTR